MGKTTDKVTGQVKEQTGRLTGDEGLEKRGRDKQAKGNLKSSAKKAKDTVKKSF